MARLGIKQTSRMCYRLGSSLNAGVDVLRLLQRESQHGSAAYRRNMERVADKITRGTTLAEALNDCGDYFPPLVRELINVGEETGRLEAVLLRLADHYQHVIKLRNTFLLGILWPGVQLVGAVLVIGLLIWLLGALGTSASVFGLSGTGGLLIYTIWIVAVAGALTAIVYALRRGWFGPLPSRMLLRVPGVGNAIKTMSLARLTWTLSMTLESGVDAGRSISLALMSTQNPLFMRHIPDVQGTIVRGGQFHEALEKTGAFPQDFLHALQNAELSGTESESLSRMSSEYQRQAEGASTALAILASFAIWGLVAALVVFLIFYLFMNLYVAPYREAFEMLDNP